MDEHFGDLGDLGEAVSGQLEAVANNQQVQVMLRKFSTRDGHTGCGGYKSVPGSWPGNLLIGGVAHPTNPICHCGTWFRSFYLMACSSCAGNAATGTAR